MKLKIATIIALAFLSLGLRAQSLSLSQTTIAMAVDGHIDYGDILVTNTTGNDLVVKVRQEPILTVADEKLQICWGGLCFNWQANAYTYATPAAIDGMADYDGLAIAFQPNSAVSGSIWRVCFFVDGNPDDEVCLEVAFGTVGVSETEKPVATLGDASPNPALQFTMVPFAGNDGNASLLVRNLMGQEVFKTALPAGDGRFKLDLSGFENGVYFYSLVSGTEVVFTKRLLVGQ